MKNIDFEKCSVRLYVSEKMPDTMVYLHVNNMQTDDIWEKLHEPKPGLALIYNIDWNADLSPWRAEAVFKSDIPFKGRAKEHLDYITETVIPEAETNLDIKNRCAAGYSLGGLFAVWSIFNTNAFNCIMSASSSLWYDGFTEYIKNNRPVIIPDRVYFSLGDKEKKTGNMRMKTIEKATLESAETLRAYGAKTFFEFNKGGHFSDVSQRIANGIEKTIARDEIWK